MRDVLRRGATADEPPQAAVDGREARRAPRFTLLIRAAKLISEQGEFLCVVRDASETGVNVRLFHDLPPGGSMVLEMQNGDRHEAEMVWQRDDRAGLRFLQPTDIARIVECPSRFAKRPVRVNVEAPAVIMSGLQQAKATMLDISQQGAKLRCDYRFSIDQRVKLSADGLPEVNAKIRWRRDDEVGMVFEDTFQFGDLARMIAVLQLDRSN